MVTLYERITSLCRDRGITGGKMCTDLRMSKGTLTDLKMGRQKSLSAEKAQKIASYFGVSVGYLLGEEIKKEKPTIPEDDGLSESKRKLIDKIKKLPEDQVQLLLQVAERIQ